jgi:epoxyqueuosine reductase QueG
MAHSGDAPRVFDLARELGFDLVGAAEISSRRDTVRIVGGLAADLPFALSLGKRLNDAVLEDIEDRPTQLYFHHYRQMNFFLDRGAMLLADSIQRSGFRAMPIPASQVIDWKNQRAHLSHKHAAAAAGLGWIGRNNLLVNPELGARFRLVTVLTDQPLPAGEPLPFSCGGCRACLSVCPAGAIKENREDFDHLACFEKLKEFRNKGYVGQFICGVCVRACGREAVKAAARSRRD